MRRMIAAALVLAATGLSIAGADTRAVGGTFSMIQASGQFKVQISAGEPGVEVTGPDASRIATRVQGDKLFISLINPPWFGPDPHIDATVQVHAPHLTALQVSRGVEVDAQAVQAGNLDLHASMGGVLHIAGACDQLDASASMGGVLDAAGLSCASVRASASMGGTLSASAHDAAEGRASMGGTIEISGNPGQRTRSAIMGGEVSFN